MQPIPDTYCFHLGCTQYQRVKLRGWLFLASFVVAASVSFFLGCLLWKSYTHVFTPYLKWQDAVVALLWFIAFISLGGSGVVVRFLCELHAGYHKGTLTLDSKNILKVRDLSHENLISIFWMMNSAFWCFVAVLVGLIPLILIEWTLHIPSPLLSIVATGLAILLSLAGVVVSMIAAVFIVIGGIGAINFCRKLGSSHIYRLSSEHTLRIDNFVLTIIHPGRPETMVDLDLLTAEEQRRLLSLLYKRWKDAQEAWNPCFGDEIEQALEKAEPGEVLV